VVRGWARAGWTQSGPWRSSPGRSAVRGHKAALHLPWSRPALPAAAAPQCSTQLDPGRMQPMRETARSPEARQGPAGQETSGTQRARLAIPRRHPAG
jgi:hypothetical protein